MERTGSLDSAIHMKGQEHSRTLVNPPPQAPRDSLGEQPLRLAVSRTFSPGAIDLDDLTEAVRQLLGSSNEPLRDPDLLLKRRRVSQVMESKEVPTS